MQLKCHGAFEVYGNFRCQAEHIHRLVPIFDKHITDLKYINRFEITAKWKDCFWVIHVQKKSEVSQMDLVYLLLLKTFNFFSKRFSHFWDLRTEKSFWRRGEISVQVTALYLLFQKIKDSNKNEALQKDSHVSEWIPKKITISFIWPQIYGIKTQHCIVGFSSTVWLHWVAMIGLVVKTFV